jgi:S-adenosylmethionine:tRNA ribosyltransferase-isomerase
VIISDFDYPLPPERIAQVPSPVRDLSKLLVVKGSGITEDLFRNLPSYLSEENILVFNDTKVIRARLLFRKPTGAGIEILCLEPHDPPETETAFLQRGHSSWKCLVGNAKRWRTGPLELKAGCCVIRAEHPQQEGDGTFLVKFSWDPEDLTFGEALGQAGHIPLPPYIHREDTPEDRERYQTIYAAHDGSVAAPTAGLHFTPLVMNALSKKQVSFEYLTLHVGMGTFRPVAVNDISEHVMHRERISVSLSTLRSLLSRPDKHIVSVGTTAARTLESLYWLGVRLITDGPAVHPEVSQWDPYQGKYPTGIPREEALDALVRYVESSGTGVYHGETQLLIMPGYEYRMVEGLVTNFHMPRSTLLLLVAALAGERWREAYTYALKHGFRFLSYGDACLFFRD